MNVDSLTKELAELNNQVLAIAFTEGEQTLKVLKKEQSWNILSKEDTVKTFDAHLANLKIRCTPRVEVIQPNRSGSFPFLKVTFFSTQTNKIQTSMLPKYGPSAGPLQREAN